MNVHDLWVEFTTFLVLSRRLPKRQIAVELICLTLNGAKVPQENFSLQKTQANISEVWATSLNSIRIRVT